MTHCEEVIITTQKRVGTGKGNESPIGIVKQVFSKYGDLIVESDSFGNHTVGDIINFSSYVIELGIKFLNINVLENWVANKRK